MFIREYKTKNKKLKTTYITHRLIESYRTEKGPRQRIVMHLGKLELPKKRWEELAAILEARLSGQTSFLEEDKTIASIADDVLRHNQFVKKQREEDIEIAGEADMQEINLNRIGKTLDRSLGPELIANTIWERLDFDQILKKCGFNAIQLSLAKAIILGRLIRPGSELSTWKWFQNTTALIEMTPYDLTGMGKDMFYEIGDLLFMSKAEIEKELAEKEKKEFMLDKKVFLYDLTNTYIEGSATGNKKARRGKSKEKRNDCPLVALALVVDESGFPLFSQIYEGNKSEPETLADVLKRLEKDGERAFNGRKPVLIMDKGIATNDNIELIKSKQYEYTVVTRRQAEKDYEKEFSSIKTSIEGHNVNIPDGWEVVDKKSSVYVKQIMDENICHVLSISTSRAGKERSMDELKEKRFIEDMGKIKKSFEKGYIVLPVKVAERVGKVKGKYPSIAKYYEIDIKISDDGKKVTEVLWWKKPSRLQRSTLTGCYVIESTQKNLSGKEIWYQYMQMNRVECAFQDLKSELGLRPIHHQTEKRTDAHLFIGVLAYHLLNSIENILKANGDTREWNTIKQELSTHERSTVILNGANKKTYHIRVSGTPESNHNEIYRMLKVKDPLKSKKTCVFSRM
jgi:transposase